MSVTRMERAVFVRLRSRKALIAKMDERRISCRELATLVGCHPSFIGHLRSGRKDSCTSGLARKIEDKLNARPASLFVAEISTPRRRVAKAA